MSKSVIEKINHPSKNKQTNIIIIIIIIINKTKQNNNNKKRNDGLNDKNELKIAIVLDV